MNFHSKSFRSLQRQQFQKPNRKLTIFGFTVREVLLVVIVAFPCMGTFFPLDSYLLANGLGSVVAKTPFNTTLILTVILSYVFWLYSRNIPKALTAFRRNWIIFAFILWAMYTAHFTTDPGASFNRSGRLLVFALYGVYLTEFPTHRRAMQIVLISLAVSIAMSLLMIVAVPSLSHVMDDMRGAWRGAMQHKNNLGVTVGVAFVASILAFYDKLLDRRLCVAIALVSLVLLKLANSATALLSMVVIVAFMAFMIFIVNRTRQPLIVLGSTLLAVGAVVPVVMSSGIVFELLNRDSTLTGRAEVWEFVHSMIDANPFWGYGHGIWTNDWFKELARSELMWPVPHAHNAWLDFRLQLGIPGLLLAICIWANATRNCLALINARRVTSVALPLATFAFISIRTYSETIVCDPSLNDMFWLAFIHASFARGAIELRNRRKSVRLTRNGFSMSAVSARSGMVQLATR